MKQHLNLFIGLVIGLAYLSNPSWASQYQNLNQLHLLAKKFLQQEIGPSGGGEVHIKVSQLDPRLKLKHCPDNQLEAYLPLGNQPLTTSTVGIRCRSATPWSIFVPVQVNMMVDALVATRSLNAGSVIRRSDIKMSQVITNQLNHGYYQTPQVLIGKVVKRPVPIGRAISPYDVKAAMMITKGSSVTITADVGGIKVRMAGEALSSGGKGEIISVRNRSSNKIIEARIVGPQQVAVKL